MRLLTHWFFSQVWVHRYSTPLFGSCSAAPAWLPDEIFDEDDGVRRIKDYDAPTVQYSASSEFRTPSNKKRKPVVADAAHLRM